MVNRRIFSAHILKSHLGLGAFLILLLLGITEVASAKPLQTTSRHTIIIDTDGAIDDLRAISMLLSRPEITIKAIIVTDGSLAPGDSYRKVVALLHRFGRDTIPVGVGEIHPHAEVPWREFNRNIQWADPFQRKNAPPTAADLLLNMTIASPSPLILVCLGPLTTLNEALQKNASFARKVEKIIWYNESVNPPRGFNYACDSLSASHVMDSGIRTDVISNLGADGLIFDPDMYRTCAKSGTALAGILYKVHSQKAVKEKLDQMHFRICDELVAIYLTNPELFDISPLMSNVKVRFDKDFNKEAIREVFTDMITGAYAPSDNVVFNQFPVSRELFAYDVRQIMDSAILRYGLDEWKANVMTDEFHGHLGVYSIVGAKMGIRAREWFGVGPDMLEAVSYSGLNPPYSCLTDGIQASTGATLGMGTIRVDTTVKPRPEALFMYKGKTIRIRLKDDYLKQVDADIREGIVKFGLLDDGYWKLIRQNALKYWLEWDRGKIFDIEVQ